MQCTQPSLPAAAAAAARGAYRATNSACPKAEQDPCKAVCNSFPLLPLAYSNSAAAASSIWYSSSSSIVVQGSLGNFLIIKIESLLLLFLSHFSLQLCFTILFCSLFLILFFRVALLGLGGGARSGNEAFCFCCCFFQSKAKKTDGYGSRFLVGAFYFYG